MNLSYPRQFADHRREWREFLYVYPVISRRSGGVSIGINLNPDKICNFDCVYCEVDRRSPARAGCVDPAVLEAELRAMLTLWRTGELFEDERFQDVPAEYRRLNDIAFSGEGEPTTCRQFPDAVRIAAQVRAELAAPETKLILISNATCFDHARVIEGLNCLIRHPHEIWAKLDAGTESYYRQVDRSHVAFQRILNNIQMTASRIPLVIQSLFLRYRGEGPSDAEIAAYCARLNGILQAGGRLLRVQLYTVARPPAESEAAALPASDLDRIAGLVGRETGLPVQLAYGG